MTHKEASRAAAESACLLCGRTGSCVPAHFPKHTGMGGGKDKWNPELWVPLCGQPGACHDLVDGRNGIGSAKGHQKWVTARETVSARVLNPF